MSNIESHDWENPEGRGDKPRADARYVGTLPNTGVGPGRRSVQVALGVVPERRVAVPLGAQPG